MIFYSKKTLKNSQNWAKIRHL